MTLSLTGHLVKKIRHMTKQAKDKYINTVNQSCQLPESTITVKLLIINNKATGNREHINREEPPVSCSLLGKIRVSESPTLIYMEHINHLGALVWVRQPTPYAIRCSLFPVPR
ncbi:hypothetical protein F7734_53070 [Scytonema sp. UIC 10036]|uniref:hypothetical protein n=1 Tax=Scytonema sp. UIC 10036 TaxID=2304196 RepID=UPI0012DABF5B|nr:hypothetical protein [Scytonema sp. UIC 10036]MUH00547.1 hypothetical protein [Scytonema sp. UIC 10036]